MTIHHIGIYVNDLEAVKEFFVGHFGFTSGEMYYNPKKEFRSYLLTATGGGCRIELMNRPDVPGRTDPPLCVGLQHISIAVGSEKAVDEYAARLSAAGYEILDGPRKTGDGFYECCIKGMEGLLIEICSEPFPSRS